MSSKKKRSNSKCIFLDFPTFIDELCLVIFHFILCHVFFISTKEKLFEIELVALYPLSSLFGNAHKDLAITICLCIISKPLNGSTYSKESKKKFLFLSPKCTMTHNVYCVCGFHVSYQFQNKF